MNYTDESLPDIGLTAAQGTLLQLSTQLRMDNRVGVGCVGAIITHLQRMRTSEYLPDDPNAETAYQISHLDTFTLRGTM